MKYPSFSTSQVAAFSTGDDILDGILKNACDVALFKMESYRNAVNVATLGNEGMIHAQFRPIKWWRDVCETFCLSIIMAASSLKDESNLALVLITAEGRCERGFFGRRVIEGSWPNYRLWNPVVTVVEGVLVMKPETILTVYLRMFSLYKGMSWRKPIDDLLAPLRALEIVVA